MLRELLSFAIVRLVLFPWLFLACGISASYATVIELNNTGGTSATNGLHFYIEDTTHIQVKRLNNTGQVYDPTTVPPSTNLDNGIFLRANGKVYGPDHNVATFAPSGGMYNTFAITATSPANPSSSGIQQISTSNFGITSGPQVTVVWKYTTPLDFLTAEVTLVIPAAYAVSAANPVRYYHAFDTFLGGTDNGCGVRYQDTDGNWVIGTYPPSSGTSCLSSTSIPAGVSVVESFRERDGLTFSNYCATGWAEFWSGSNCSVLQSTNMNNTIVTTYQDTGIGIQYNFTAPGTYTFSYDFVVGSFVVPPYDHLEIRHPGTASLCPENLTVLACTSSTMPCPAANIVNSGTLTGMITTTPTTPNITKSPATFTLGSSASTATVSLTGVSPGGSYTLGTSGLSATPLNGTKCWNTTTSSASCSFTVTSSPCVSNFECIQTGLTYNNLTTNPATRNPLYTELAGTGFKFDVVALQSGGVQATAYTAASGVTVELFDDSASPQPACSAYTSAIASQAITFVAGDSGRKTLPADFTVANAYRKLRCRVKDTNVSIYGCSSDDFSVRPTNFTVSSTNANADVTGVSTSVTPKLAAGSNFSLTAATGLTGYNGAPSIDSTKLAAHSGAIQVGALTGNFNTASSGTATGVNFSYGEVGYLRFNANGVYDDTFTAIDSAAGDCASGFTTSGGKYACNFGNTSATNYFGRFTPDHFDTIVTQGCIAGGFTYSAQPFNTEITARNLSGGRTQNYEGISSFSKTTTLSDANAVAGGSIAPSSVAASAFVAGIANATPAFSFTSTKTAPTTIKLHAIDLDNVASSATEGTALIRSGRLSLKNVYGSELLALPLALEAQYWNGTSYIRNQLDSCTVVPASSIAMSNYKINLSGNPTCETQLGYSSGSGAFINGVSKFLRLTKPGAGNNGSVDLTLNLNAASGNTCNTASPSAATAAGIPWFGTNPASRATFGIYKTPIIYLRENF
jgi:hypothetical protein